MYTCVQMCLRECNLIFNLCVPMPINIYCSNVPFKLIKLVYNYANET